MGKEGAGSKALVAGGGWGVEARRAAAPARRFKVWPKQQHGASVRDGVPGRHRGVARLSRAPSRQAPRQAGEPPEERSRAAHAIGSRDFRVVPVAHTRHVGALRVAVRNLGSNLHTKRFAGTAGALLVAALSHQECLAWPQLACGSAGTRN